MTATPGHATHKICPSCDLEITDGTAGATCPRCGTKLVEIRGDGDDLIGSVIDGRFEIRAKLGQGGMGTVYRAWQRSVGREVAIKLMDRAYSSDPMSVRRFLREARLASQLSQPNTVSVFDFGQAADGRLFIAMELIRGRTLQKMIEAEGTFPIPRVLRIGIQICDALEAAHAAGIIHRDLKLENVIVLDHPPGRDLLKVLDFGLAKNIREPGSRGTESGVVVGTPRYMAPEAAMTGESLPAGDVYALGVILGELASGKPLWEGENLAHLVTQKLDPAPAVRMVPLPLARLVGALIDPEPVRRPTAPQAREMLVALGDGPDAGETLQDAPNSGSTVSLRTPQPGPRLTAPTRSETPSGQPWTGAAPAPGAMTFDGRSAPAVAVLGADDRSGPVVHGADDRSGPVVHGADDRSGPVVPRHAEGRSGNVPPAGARLAAPAQSEVVRPPRRRGLVWIGLLALAFGITVGALLATQRGDHAEKKPPTADNPDNPLRGIELTKDGIHVQRNGLDITVPSSTLHDDPSPPEAAPPAFVTLDVVTTPPGATIFVEGEREPMLEKTPGKFDTSRTADKIVLRAKLKGYEDRTVEVTPDRDQPVTITLRKLATTPRSSDTVLPF